MPVAVSYCRLTMNNSSFRTCIVIPVYNHEDSIGKILPALLDHQLPIILVDDGSDVSCQIKLQQLASQYDQVALVRLSINRGKGGAVKAGLFRALDLGFSHAIQIDADGQHHSEDIGRFLEQAKENPSAIICGIPIYDQSVPLIRYYARYLTHIWIWINTLSLKVKDSMCGFRVYPLAKAAELLDGSTMGDRMDFDPEILVHWVWDGGDIINIPTKVGYPIDGVSHFAPWRDNYLISKMHTKLFFLMLIKSPRLITRKLTAGKKNHA